VSGSRPENIDRILDDGWDIIVDGADKLPHALPGERTPLCGGGIPVVHGSIYRFEGQATVFKPHEGPCYRCLFPEPPPPELAPSCSEGGVLGVLPGIIGSIQANEAIKLAAGIGEPLIGAAAAVRCALHRVQRSEDRFATRTARSAATRPRSPSTSTTWSSARR